MAKVFDRKSFRNWMVCLQLSIDPSKSVPLSFVAAIHGSFRKCAFWYYSLKLSRYDKYTLRAWVWWYVANEVFTHCENDHAHDGFIYGLKDAGCVAIYDQLSLSHPHGCHLLANIMWLLVFDSTEHNCTLINKEFQQLIHVSVDKLNSRRVHNGLMAIS